MNHEQIQQLLNAINKACIDGKITEKQMGKILEEHNIPKNIKKKINKIYDGIIKRKG